MGEQILVIQYVGVVQCGVFLTGSYWCGAVFVVKGKFFVNSSTVLASKSIGILAQDLISLGSSVMPQQSQFHRRISTESYWFGQQFNAITESEYP